LQQEFKDYKTTAEQLINASNFTEQKNLLSKNILENSKIKLHHRNRNALSDRCMAKTNDQKQTQSANHPERE